MADQKVRFDDGDAYERMMGTWSRLVGETFLDWLALPPGLQCIDVGCGNGAFTELLVKRCAPTMVEGIDPAAAQLSYARARHTAGVAEFRQGDAMALPYPGENFDAAVMALVIFFVPDPPKGVAEMTRVVRPGGTVAAYTWDVSGGGSPIEPVQAELVALGKKTVRAPVTNASSIEALRDMWSNADLEAIETHKITVQRSFPDFEEFWAVTLAGSAVGQSIAALSSGDAEIVKNRVRAKLPPDIAGRITYAGCANAIKGRVPK
jgi:ubiquinone/menaquinone biosynthesis C-methylase UbiE